MGKTTRIGHDDEVKSLITPVELGEGVPQKKQEKVALPVGTVTLLLADAEGSTRLWESDPDSIAPATHSHDRIVDEAIGRIGGVKPKDQGEGDSFVAAFSRPSDALAAALEIQQSLVREESPIRLRMAVHTGEVQLRNESNYIGVAINRTARIRAAGHGGQILLSQVSHDLVADRLPKESPSRISVSIGSKTFRGRNASFRFSIPTSLTSFPCSVRSIAFPTTFRFREPRSSDGPESWRSCSRYSMRPGC